MIEIITLIRKTQEEKTESIYISMVRLTCWTFERKETGRKRRQDESAPKSKLKSSRRVPSVCPPLFWLTFATPSTTVEVQSFLNSACVCKLLFYHDTFLFCLKNWQSNSTILNKILLNRLWVIRNRRKISKVMSQSTANHDSILGAYRCVVKTTTWHSTNGCDPMIMCWWAPSLHQLYRFVGKWRHLKEEKCSLNSQRVWQTDAKRRKCPTN